MKKLSKMDSLRKIQPAVIPCRMRQDFFIWLIAGFWLKIKKKCRNSLKYLTKFRGFAIMIKNVKELDLKEFFCKSKLRFTEEVVKERSELFHRLIALPKPERDAVLMAVEYYEAHKHEGRFPDGRK